MYGFIGTLILVGIFLVSLLFCVFIYNKLVIYKSELMDNYDKLYVLIKDKFYIVEKNISSKDKELFELVVKFKKLNEVDDVINLALLMDRQLFKYRRRVWYKEYKEINDELSKIKVVYNNNVLRFNNLLKSFPISVISNLFGFEPWLYYRVD
jgi:hypothetical protein